MFSKCHMLRCQLKRVTTPPSSPFLSAGEQFPLNGMRKWSHTHTLSHLPFSSTKFCCCPSQQAFAEEQQSAQARFAPSLAKLCHTGLLGSEEFARIWKREKEYKRQHYKKNPERR
jgi:hypothetical protein